MTLYSPARSTAVFKFLPADLERTTMFGSTRRHGSRLARALCVPGIALLLAAAGCQDSKTEGDPQISADDDRGSGGNLEALTVKGKRYTPNGPVLVTVAMAASGGNASPYVEETVQADGNGEFQYERRPVPCPQPADYERGSFIMVVARDMTSGISSSRTLDPGAEPDCRP